MMFNVKEKLSHRLLLMGLMHRGRTALMDIEAQHLGLSHEEMGRILEITPEQQRAAEAREAAEYAALCVRWAAIRDAWWAHTEDTSLERVLLQEALAHAGLPQATSEQQRALFDALPPSLLGQTIAWGMADIAVRADLFSFAQEYQALRLTPSAPEPPHS
jgi:hypothetical protein